MRILVFLCAVWCSVISGALAQSAEQRYELGWRLRELERLWADVRELGGEGLLEGALEHVEESVQSFFAFDIARAAMQMDQASNRLWNELPYSEDTPSWTSGFGLIVRPRLVDVDCTKLSIEASWFYPGGPVLGEDSHADWFRIEGPELLGARRVEGNEEGPAESYAVRFTGPGEAQVHLARVSFLGGRTEAVRVAPISVVESLEPRLQAAREALAELPEEVSGFARASSAGLVEVLESLAAGEIFEVDLPGGAWLRELERRLSAIGAGDPFIGAGSPGDHWVGFPRRSKTTPARLFIPEGLDPEEPAPLVIALHGAGGSEHMFFDAYGNGKLVELAKQRGWIVVSPYHALIVPPDVEGMVAMLSEVLPVDASRVAVVGHSMGAVAGLGATERAPGAVAALVAMGGGRLPKDVEVLSGVPVHVAVGEHDFGRGGGEALHAALEESEREAALELHVVDGAEHLMVVQDGLERVFAFLDGVLAGE